MQMRGSGQCKTRKKKKFGLRPLQENENTQPRTAITTTATMAATSSILILAILAGSLLPSGAQFADPPPPSNETMPDSITVVDVGNDTTAVPEEPVAEMEGEYNQGVEDCIYADSPLSRRQVIADGYPTLWAAAQASGLTDAPENISQKLTLFAPTDEAFSKFFEENGLSPEEVLANQPLVLEVLTYHAVPAVKDFESLASEPQVRTLPLSFLSFLF